MDNLKQLRDRLDEIDRQIAGLYEKRMEICHEVGEIKSKIKKPVYDKIRELEKLHQVKELMKNENYKLGVEELYSQLLTQSRKLQYQIMVQEGNGYDTGYSMTETFHIGDKKVVFQGIIGAYSEAAALGFFGNEVKKFHVDTFKEAILAVQNKEAIFGVLPIENSSAGTVLDVYDLLSEYEISIVGEIVIPISHMLCGIDGATVDDIQRVYSHPQAIMQCSDYLEKHAYMEAIGVANTAVAAREVNEAKDSKRAAICSEEAAKLYCLSILEREINMSKENETRFVILSNQRLYRKDASKLSICFELTHEPGSLYRVLSHVIFNGLNMTKIESRPVKNKPWEYKFFLDFEGNLSDGEVQNALLGIKEESIHLKILGNY